MSSTQANGESLHERVTVRQFAERHGLTHQAVLAALRRGTLRYADARNRTLDLAESDAALESARLATGRTDSTEASLVHRAGTGAAVDVQAQTAARAMATRLSEARISREEADAEMAKLRAAQLRHELVSVEQIRGQMFALLRSLRQRVLLTGERIGQRVARESSAAVCATIVEEELVQVLTEFVDQIGTLGADGS